MFKLLVLFIGGIVFLPGVAGAEAHKMSDHKISVKKTAQKKCPVMGGKINPKLYYQYKSQKIYVCCPSCIATVKKNPGKYLKKAQEQQKEIDAARNIAQKNCPVIGGVIVPGLYYEYNKKIYACSNNCIAIIKKNPEKYLRKVLTQQKETDAGKKTTQKICPVMGRKIKPGLYFKYNKKIYVCCKDCIKIIKKNPEKYLKKLQEKEKISK